MQLNSQEVNSGLSVDSGVNSLESNQTEKTVKKKDKLPKTTFKNTDSNKIKEGTINKLKQNPLPKGSKNFVRTKNKTSLRSSYYVNNNSKIFGMLQSEENLNKRTSASFQYGTRPFTSYRGENTKSETLKPFSSMTNRRNPLDQFFYIDLLTSKQNQTLYNRGKRRSFNINYNTLNSKSNSQMVSKSLSISQGNLLKLNQSDRPNTCAPLTNRENRTINKRQTEAPIARKSQEIPYNSQKSKARPSLNKPSGSIKVVSQRIYENADRLVKQRQNLLRTPLRKYTDTKKSTMLHLGREKLQPNKIEQQKSPATAKITDPENLKFKIKIPTHQSQGEVKTEEAQTKRLTEKNLRNYSESVDQDFLRKRILEWIGTAATGKEALQQVHHTLGTSPEFSEANAIVIVFGENS